MAEIVQMTRRVTFSSGHRYWIPSLSETENRALFGRWASPFNHGHNYVLDVCVEGAVDRSTGMVVNIKRIDDVLKHEVVSEFDNRSINDQIPAFQTRSSSLENIIRYISDRLSNPGVLPPEVRLNSLRLEEMPTLYAELTLDESKPMLTLTRSYEFAASHRLDSQALTPEQNLEIFGKCNNPAGHGHNYVLEVSVTGEPAADTGMLADLGELDRAVEERVILRYDHKNLNVDVPELAGKTTTSEVVALEIFRLLDGHVPAKLLRVRLYETARNMFEVSA